MQNDIVLTKAQVDAEINCYRKVFDVVRLLHKDQIAGICKKEDIVNRTCPCFSFWGKDEACDNCVSAKAWQTKTDETKIEFSADEIYQVIAHYVEVDGEPCVMELLKKFDLEHCLDLSGEEKLLAQVKGYYEKTYSDVMTGVKNRRFYEEKLKSTTLNAGIAMMDIDDFKVYNDVYGHIAGDAVIKAIAEKIQNSIRSTDKLVRYGGDEFLLVMTGVAAGEFDSALKNIRQSIGTIKVPGYEHIKLTISIGATLCKNELAHIAVNRADRLLYKAKLQKDVVITDRYGESSFAAEKPSVLIVDDSAINREVLSSILSNEYNIIEADSGEACLAALKRFGTQISVVLLDMVMPGMNGFAVLEHMNKTHLIEEIPVITITGDKSTIQKAYEMGVSDFIYRPFDAKIVYRRVSNTINLYEKQKRLVSAVSNEILEKEKCSRILVDILSQVAEFCVGIGGEHIANINRITELLLVRLREKTDKYDLTDKDIYLIKTASALHDIGKVGISSEILNKPGKLTPEEYEIVKKHTEIGAEIVLNLREYREEPLVKYAHDICLYHHERYDGGGYPTGLKGDDIPIAAQVVSMADAYDALTAKRVYKEAYSSEEAVDMILDGKCGKFNLLLLECLEDIRKFLVKDRFGQIK